MAQVYNKLEIDVHGKIRGLATPVQNDANSRFLDVVLLDNGTAINLTGHEVRIYCNKPENGGEIYNNGVITDAVNGRCQFPLTDQTLAKVGHVEAQIIIYYQNVQILQTHVFKINVVKSLMSQSSIKSSNEYGALVVLFQELYEAKDLMTTMVQNQGEKGVISEDRDIETFWQSMEYVSKYLDTDLTNLLNTVLAESNVQGVIDRLGNAADTGATATAGTVMGKLNKLIASEKHLSLKLLTQTPQVNKTNLVLLSVSGAGEFYGMLGNVLNVKVIIDGIEYARTGSNGNWFIFKGAIDQNGINGNTANANLTIPFLHSMPFSKSFIVMVDTTNSNNSNTISYALYE